MAEMGIGQFAAHLGSEHPMASISPLLDKIILQGSGKVGPPTPGIEFVPGSKQGLAGNKIHIDAFPGLVPVFVLKGASVPFSLVT